MSPVKTDSAPATPNATKDLARTQRNREEPYARRPPGPAQSRPATADRVARRASGASRNRTRRQAISRSGYHWPLSKSLCKESAQQACADRDSWVVLRPRDVGTDCRWCARKTTRLQRLVTGARRPRRQIRFASESVWRVGAAPERVPDLHRRQRGQSTGNLGGHVAPVCTPRRCRNDAPFTAVVATSDRRGHRQDRPPYPSRHHSRNDSRNHSRCKTHPPNAGWEAPSYRPGVSDTPGARFGDRCSGSPSGVRDKLCGSAANRSVPSYTSQTAMAGASRRAFSVAVASSPSGV